MYSFIETKLFSRLVADYLTDEEYSGLQQTLINDPEIGDLIAGSGAASANCAGASLVVASAAAFA